MALLFGAGAHDGPTWYRIEVPAAWLRRQGIDVHVRYDQVDEAQGHLAGVTACRWSRGCDPTLLFAVLGLQQRGIPCLYDLDDDVWQIPEWNPLHADMNPAKLKTMTSLLRVCAGVTTTTEILAARLRALNPAVHVIPNGLPPEALGPLRPRRLPGFRVGWAGSFTHAEDLAEARAALRQFLAGRSVARLVFMGWCPPEWVGHPQVEVHDWVDPPAYYAALQALELDVFLAPLAPHPFNAAKSDLKLAEAGAMGWPMIATEFGPYAEGPEAIPGLRIQPGSPAGWYQALVMLAEHPEFRQRLSREALAWVVEHRTIEQVGPKWAELLLGAPALERV